MKDFTIGFFIESLRHNGDVICVKFFPAYHVLNLVFIALGNLRILRQ